MLMVSAHSLSMDIIMDIEMIETEREMCGSEQVYRYGGPGRQRLGRVSTLGGTKREITG